MEQSDGKIRLNKTKTLRFVGFVVVLTLFFGLLGSIFFVERTWQDAATWTFGDKFLVPKEITSLRINIDKKATTLAYSVDYCMLYAIDKSDSGITYRCSLLPNTYFEPGSREKIESALHNDTNVVFTYKSGTEPAPEEFLGRLDRSEDSLSSIGALQTPVKLSGELQFVQPSTTIMNKMKHAVIVLKRSQETIPAALTKWSITPIPATAKEKYPQETERYTYLKNWSKQAAAELKDFVKYSDLVKKDGTALLDDLANALQYQRLQCSTVKGIATCLPVYKTNVSASIAYFMDTLRLDSDALSTKFDKAVTDNLYPFSVSAPKIAGTLCANCDLTWRTMSVDQFPICPLGDIIAGSMASENVLFFKKYYATDTTIPKYTTSKEVIEALQALSFEQIKTGERDLMPVPIQRIEGACYAIASGNVTARAAVRQLQITYWNLMNAILGREPVGEVASVENLAETVYQSYEYQPYKSVFLADNAIPRYRALRYESINEQANALMQWKSVQATTTILYLTKMAQ